MKNAENRAPVRQLRRTCAAVLSAVICAGSCLTTVTPAKADSVYEVPRVYIQTAEGNGNYLVKSDGYTNAQIEVADRDGSTVSGAGEVKVRGNTTAGGAKKPYTVKFESKKNVLGMGKAKKWALLADCYDPTLLRNRVALDFADELGLEFTPDHEYVELYMDDVYKGCYELVEPVEAKSDRVDIDVDGNKDFLLQFESSRVDEEAVYIAPSYVRFEIKEPEEPDAEQVTYIYNTMDEIINVMKTADYETISKYVDMDSFAAYYLLNEFYKTVDFSFSSVYYYYKDGILYAGPAWDYDMSSGNTYSANVRKLDPAGQDANVQLFSYLCQCPEFMDKVREVYREHYRYIQKLYLEGGYIDQLVNTYGSVFARNFSEAGWEVSSLYTDIMRTPEATYQENVEYFKNWLSERNIWMSRYYCIFDDDYADKYERHLSSAPIVYSTPGYGCAQISWTSVSKAEKYGVMIYKNGRWTGVQDGYGNSYTLQGLKEGVDYKVAVIARINGVWQKNFSHAITVNAYAKTARYPLATAEVQGNAFRLRWNSVPGASEYAVGYYKSGRWKVLASGLKGNVFTQNRVNNGTYKLVVIAKRNGVWDTAKIDRRAVTVTIG